MGASGSHPTAGLSIDPWMDVMGKGRTFSISFPTEGSKSGAVLPVKQQL
jgi:hypothetical protein